MLQLLEEEAAIMYGNGEDGSGDGDGGDAGDEDDDEPVESGARHRQFSVGEQLCR